MDVYDAAALKQQLDSRDEPEDSTTKLLSEAAEALLNDKRAKASAADDKYEVPELPVYPSSIGPIYAQYELLSKSWNVIGILCGIWVFVLPFTLEWKAGFRSRRKAPVSARVDIVSWLIEYACGNDVKEHLVRSLRYQLSRNQPFMDSLDPSKRLKYLDLYPRLAMQHLSLVKAKDEDAMGEKPGVRTGALNALALLFFIPAYTLYLIWKFVQMCNTSTTGSSKDLIGEVRSLWKRATSRLCQLVENLWALALVVALLGVHISGTVGSYIGCVLILLGTLVTDFSIERLILISVMLCNLFALKILRYVVIDLAFVACLVVGYPQIIGAIWWLLKLIQSTLRRSSGLLPTYDSWRRAGSLPRVMTSHIVAWFRSIRNRWNGPSGESPREPLLTSELVAPSAPRQ